MKRRQLAKNVSGAQLSRYDTAARRRGYNDWHEFIVELDLMMEDAVEALTVLEDMSHGWRDAVS